jgi:hypothetical protein
MTLITDRCRLARIEGMTISSKPRGDISIAEAADNSLPVSP